MPSPPARSMPIGMPMMWRTSVRWVFAGTPAVSASRPGGARVTGGLRDLPGCARAVPTRAADAFGMDSALAPPPRPLWHDAPAPAAIERAPRRRPARQRPVVVDVLAALAGIGLGITIGLA